MNYMVVECRKTYAVVLSQDGKFIKTANLNYTVGQTVTEIVEMTRPKPSNKIIYRFATLAACLVLVCTAVLGLFNKPYASVYVKINPQVRIDVNKEDTVVGLKGVNADGEKLIQNYSYSGKHLDLVMDELLDLAIAQNYLSQGKTVTVTFDGKDQNWVVSHEEHLSSHLQAYLKEKISVRLEVGDISEEIIREIAEEVAEEILEETTENETELEDYDEDDDFDDDFDVDEDDDFDEDDFDDDEDDEDDD